MSLVLSMQEQAGPHSPPCQVRVVKLDKLEVEIKSNVRTITKKNVLNRADF